MTEVCYIDSSRATAKKEFAAAFCTYLKRRSENYSDIVILCIGTDRSTGDSLGPLIGHKLSKTNILFNGIKIFGTLESPIHAKNINWAIEEIYSRFSKPLVIAIDACLGKHEHIGYLTISEGAVSPGAGIKKLLPKVGDISITGIVNFYKATEATILYNTRLNLIMKMADIVHHGIIEGFSMIWNLEELCFME